MEIGGTSGMSVCIDPTLPRATVLSDSGDAATPRGVRRTTRPWGKNLQNAARGATL